MDVLRSIVLAASIAAFAHHSLAQGKAPAISGAYSGTDNCPQPRKMKVALQGASDGSLTGLVTFYLPPTSTQAVSYALNGEFNATSGKFYGYVNGWKDAAPPAGFVMTGLDGTFDTRTATIEGKLTSGACTAFTASRDPEGSANVTNANVANTGLVHKSAAFWNDDGSELIRKVFDGDFGNNVADSTDFQFLFGSYVESFSSRCRTDLPTQRVSVTITQGFATNLSTATVEMDPRFADPYHAYYENLTSGGTALGILLREGPDRALKKLLEPGDVERFFARAPCRSASMRQLGENLLRAGKGQPSVQRAGVTIPGAAAESDK